MHCCLTLALATTFHDDDTDHTRGKKPHAMLPSCPQCNVETLIFFTTSQAVATCKRNRLAACIISSLSSPFLFSPVAKRPHFHSQPGSQQTSQPLVRHFFPRPAISRAPSLPPSSPSSCLPALPLSSASLPDRRPYASPSLPHCLGMKWGWEMEHVLLL